MPQPAAKNGFPETSFSHANSICSFFRKSDYSISQRIGQTACAVSGGILTSSPFIILSLAKLVIVGSLAPWLLVIALPFFVVGAAFGDTVAKAKAHSTPPPRSP